MHEAEARVSAPKRPENGSATPLIKTSAPSIAEISSPPARKTFLPKSVLRNPGKISPASPAYVTYAITMHIASIGSMRSLIDSSPEP